MAIAVLTVGGGVSLFAPIIGRVADSTWLPVATAAVGIVTYFLPTSAPRPCSPDEARGPTRGDLRRPQRRRRHASEEGLKEVILGEPLPTCDGGTVCAAHHRRPCPRPLA